MDTNNDVLVKRRWVEINPKRWTENDLQRQASEHKYQAQPGGIAFQGTMNCFCGAGEFNLRRLIEHIETMHGTDVIVRFGFVPYE